VSASPLTTYKELPVYVDPDGYFRSQVGDLPVASSSLKELQEKIDAERLRLAKIAAREAKKGREPFRIRLFDDSRGIVDGEAIYLGLLRKSKAYDAGHVVEFAGERHSFDLARFRVVRSGVTHEDLSALVAARAEAQRANANYSEMRSRMLVVDTARRCASLNYGPSVPLRVLEDPEQRTMLEEAARDALSRDAALPMRAAPAESGR